MMKLIQRPVTQLQILLVLAVLLGGGGVVYGFRHMAIQLFALALLALNAGRFGDFVREAPRVLVILVALTLAFPLLQAVPLPAPLWQALPGRDLVVQAYSVTGIDTQSWFTFSVDPLRTLTSFCATLAPAAMIVLGWSLSQEDRHVLVKTLVAVALGAFLLGTLQLSSANTFGILQDIDAGPDVFYATFSNRNSTGIFFVIATITLAAVPLPSGRLWPMLAAGAGALMVIAVVLTQSRSSMTLLVLLLAFVVARFAASYLRSKRSGVLANRRPMIIGSAIVVVIGIVAIVASVASGGRAAQSLERFSQIDGDRLEMWDDGAFVAKRYWPVGSGTGTFDEVFQIDESLAYVSPGRAGRAHNDYIELAIETGVIGILVLLAWFAWLGWATWQRRNDADRWLAFAAIVSFTCIALQSVLDYPLRNHAMLCIAGLLVVLLLPAREKSA
ncbi:O-antigen ligase family protein [Aurantiacibacter sp. MUD11]|uniref:O-antigen ligase family protein n=1 Tax=Aurantiacibacter sp. MUD11 TaxID=3003265 RepID=UPI0022AA0336|nr:O-antigen ligase family protein [Aurantiacibacter sp. MUD11]WAT17020.1 O-antigen ligase family protein [Aurantiacibacter sp. MUD11]